MSQYKDDLNLTAANQALILPSSREIASQQLHSNAAQAIGVGLRV